MKKIMLALSVLCFCFSTIACMAMEEEEIDEKKPEKLWQSVSKESDLESSRTDLEKSKSELKEATEAELGHLGENTPIRFRRIRNFYARLWTDEGRIKPKVLLWGGVGVVGITASVMITRKTIIPFVDKIDKGVTEFLEVLAAAPYIAMGALFMSVYSKTH